MLHERPMSYLYEVGIQGGIRRAADMLGINPSVISRQIAQLERALELPLLERQGAKRGAYRSRTSAGGGLLRKPSTQGKAGKPSEGFTPHARRDNFSEDWRRAGHHLY